MFNEMTHVQELSSSNPNEFTNSRVINFESYSEKEITNDDSVEFTTPDFEGRDIESEEQFDFDDDEEENTYDDSEEETTEEPESEEVVEPPKFATIFNTDHFILPTTEEVDTNEFSSTEEFTSEITSSVEPIITPSFKEKIRETESIKPTSSSEITSTLETTVTKSIITSSSSEIQPSETKTTKTKNVPHSQTPTPALPYTQILISTKYETKTLETTRLRTYTFIITTSHDNEQIVTSTTEVRPQIKTTTVTDTLLVTRTVTLTNPLTASNVPGSSFHYEYNIADEGRRFNQDEARYNLATRIMSNGVEVIVAGDKSTYPGDPMMRRIVSTGNKPITLAPSTLSDHMQMLLPQDASEITNKFVTRTCLTTYTYLTTYLENGSTTVKSHEQVISNTATEERKPLGIVATPTASSAITLTQNPNLATGVFHTTYTYFNTIMDDEQPLVITSKHTVANTVTAPDDYLSILQPSESVTPVLDTNTYLSTVSLTKTLVEGTEQIIVSTTDVVTQVVVTESIPPQGTSVMTSYTAYDVEDIVATPSKDYSTSDVVRTYFVTYTYYNTFLENDKTVVKTNVSTSSDIVTEKIYLHPKRTQANSATQSPIVTTPISEKMTSTLPIDIFVTKTYLTTYTYFTTYLQEGQNKKKSTVSSNTHTVENVATESLTSALLDPTLLRKLGESLGTDSVKSVVTTATLNGGEEIEITAVQKGQIKPTKTQKIESTSPVNTIVQTTVLQPSSPNVITGSTIVFVDDDPFANFLAPSSTQKPSKTIKPSKQNLVSSLLSSEIVDQSAAGAENIPVIVKPSKPMFSHNRIGEKHKNNTSETKKKPLKIGKPTNGSVQVSDLINLGSLGIKTLGPIVNAMAGLIQTNLNSNRRQDNITTTTFITPRPLTVTKPPPAVDVQNRSPIYIPVGEVGEEGIETAESQDVASFQYNLPANANKWLTDEPQVHQQVVIGKPTHESPLVNGGIPISPGQVITANSDVIVGKPSVHGPRIPNFEKHQPNNVNYDDVQGMQPPPLPKPQWPARNHDVRLKEPNTEGSSKINRLKEYKGQAQHQVIPIQQYNSYGEAIGPLPDQFEQHKHLISEILSQDFNHFNRQPDAHVDNIEIKAPIKLQPTINNIPLQNYEKPVHNPQLLHVPENINVYNKVAEKTSNHNWNENPTKSNKQPTLVLGKPFNEINIKPSSGDLLSLPEVIERSTGQPLLVNLQPSQVANVVIPHGSSTSALIFGGTIEPHKNGQYFDDPSPYPEPETSGFVGINSHKPNTVPQFASISDVYPNAPNQKQVVGVINVGGQHITQGINVNVPPLNFGPSNEKTHLHHVPTNGIVLDSNHNNHDINVQVPPISFGMINHGHAHNAHIVNHGDMQHNIRPGSLNYIKNDNNFGDILHLGIVTSQQQLPSSFSGSSPSYTGFNGQLPTGFNGHQPPTAFNHQQQPTGFSAQPPSGFNTPTGEFETVHFHPGSGDLNINVSPQPLENIKPNEHVLPNGIVLDGNLPNDIPLHGHPFRNRHPYNWNGHHEPKFPPKRLPPKHFNHQQTPAVPAEFMTPPPPGKNYNSIQNAYSKPVTIPLNYEVTPIPNVFKVDNDDSLDDDKDVVSEDGQVIQESIARPLRPGQVPNEILRLNKTTTTVSTTTTTEAPVVVTQHSVRYTPRPPSYYNKPNVRPPRPFKPHNIYYHPRNTTKLVRPPIEENVPHYKPNIFSYTVTPAYRPFQNKIPKLPEIQRPIVNIPINNFDNGYKPEHNIQEPVRTTFGRPINNIFTLDHTPNKIYIPNRSTSMPVDPVDTSTSTQRVITNQYESNLNIGSQTEEPFNTMYTKSSVEIKPVTQQTFFFGNKDVSHPQKDIIRIHKDNLASNEVNIMHPVYVPSSTENSDMNKDKSEIFDSNESANPHNHDSIPTYDSSENLSVELSLEKMTPPSPPTERPTTSPIMPDIHMKPPKIEIISPSLGIHKVPSPNKPIDLDVQSNTKTPLVKPPTDEMLPPPMNTKPVRNEEVMGMNPPPFVIVNEMVTTHKPILTKDPEISTYRPAYTPIKTTKFSHPYVFETPSSEELETTTNKIYGSRRPVGFSKYPKSTTTTTSRPSSFSKPRRPVYSWTTSTSTTEKHYIFTSQRTNRNHTTIKPTTVRPVTPSMEIIIGHPSIEKEKSETKEQIINGYTDAVVADNSIRPTSVKQERPTISSTPTIATIFDNLYTKSDLESTSIYNNPVHHAGNEIKIIDESSTPTPSLMESKLMLPTKYITHTKTLTVTTTKTTVIKSLGGPPSTLTLELTKTIISTIVDTVTQTHTLIQPTSVVETVTTTISHTPSVSKHNIDSSRYPAFPVQATAILQPTIHNVDEDDEDLDEFIIKETDPPPTKNSQESYSEENDSIFVVMTDKKPGVVNIPKKEIVSGSAETIKLEDILDTHADRDEDLNHNEVNRVLLGGILIASPPSLNAPTLQTGTANECRPDCKASRNELCQRVEGVMKCVCRPGFARMFPDRPCKPTYTYRLRIALSHLGKEKLRFEPSLADKSSSRYARLAQATHDGLDRMVMQSDLRDIYHGVQVNNFEPHKDTGVINDFYVQLSDNTDELRLKEVFKKYLRNNNYSLGGTELYASKDFIHDLNATDFDECTNYRFHDCSEHAQCFNLKGTYTCSCKEGFADLSENPLYPGRICSAELIGCEKCHYHGTCYSRGDEQVLCECFQWYAGENCHINLKVLLIALVTLGAVLLTLLLVCLVMTCCRRGRRGPPGSGIAFLPHRTVMVPTLDKRAMIHDSSSEASEVPPYVPKKTKKLKGALKKPSHDTIDSASLPYVEQRDRSLTVMIPRAKYHPAPATSPVLPPPPSHSAPSIPSFEKRKHSIASSNETKLLSYLDAGPSPSKSDARRKHSNAQSDISKSARKISAGALVSAGFEVSATVGVGTLATTCGTEADRSENATLVHKISADLLSVSNAGSTSQFTTLRKRNDDDPLDDWLDTRIMTVSEARSYDETTIQPPTKSIRSGYDSKPSSQHHNNDEANTMAERDLGSTFLLPHTHLYKPDRGSDISGFDSL